MPNAHDAGIAKMLAGMGFAAVATTSAGQSATLGRNDGSLTLQEALDHASGLVSAVDVPVSSDFENGYADDPEDVAASVTAAVDTGLAGVSIEDYLGATRPGFYPLELAAERVAAAAEAAHGGDTRVVLTARAESALYGDVDFADIEPRLNAYRDAGADVLYVPGLSDPADIKRVIDIAGIPVNVLTNPRGPTVPELADLGAARISVGGIFTLVALGAIAEAAEELMGPGTFGFAQLARRGRQATNAVFD